MNFLHRISVNINLRMIQFDEIRTRFLVGLLAITKYNYLIYQGKNIRAYKFVEIFSTLPEELSVW